MGSHQHMSNFDADCVNCAREGHSLTCKIQSEKHVCAHEHANMAD